jgi:DNA-binding NarL/FixJ family response regulator
MPLAPRVVLADDERLARDIVAGVCARRGIPVLAMARDLHELAALCAALRPDVVVTGDEVGGTPVAGSLQHLSAAGIRVIVVSAKHETCPLSVLAADSVWGHLSHDAPPDEVADAILSVADGHMALDRVTATTVVRQWRRLRAGHQS